MRSNPCFAIPCIGPASRLQVRMVQECARAIRRHHPAASVHFLGRGQLVTANLDLQDCPVEVALPLQADWIKAQAFRALRRPVWVLDADIVMQRPFLQPETPAMQPYHYPLIEGRMFNTPGLVYCPTISCWYQAVDVFDAFKGAFLASPDELAGERAALYATLAAGGSIEPEPYVCTPPLPGCNPDVSALLAEQPQNPHALHYVSSLKFWHYR